MVSFAKGITSGYMPLGGVIISDHIRQVLYEQPATTKFMHAFTYSGHATCCAVGLANLDILEGEGLVERGAALGEQLQAGIAPLADHPAVKEVRGLGMMAAVEFQPGVAAPAGQLGCQSDPRLPPAGPLYALPRGHRDAGAAARHPRIRT